MPRFLILKEPDIPLETYVWDSKKEEMFFSIDGEEFSPTEFSLVSLTKFRPLTELVNESDKFPVGFSISDPSKERKRRMGF